MNVPVLPSDTIVVDMLTVQTLLVLSIVLATVVTLEMDSITGMLICFLILTLNFTIYADENECSTFPCSPLVNCNNTEGPFECGPCPYGFSGNGHGPNGCTGTITY